MIACIFEHVQWRWALNDSLAPRLQSAQWGYDEAEVAAGLEQSGVPRAEVWLTTKVRQEPEIHSG